MLGGRAQLFAAPHVKLTFNSSWVELLLSCVAVDELDPPLVSLSAPSAVCIGSLELS